MRVWVLLTSAIVLEVGGTLSLRASEGLSRPLGLAPMAVGYVGAFTLLPLVLREGMPVGMAYAVWAAAGIVLTALAGWALFGEGITLPMAVGFRLIAAGVVLVEVGAAPHGAVEEAGPAVGPLH